MTGRRNDARPRPLISMHRFELVAERAVIAALEPAFGPLPFPRSDEMFQASRSLGGRLAAFGAPAIALHAQLVLALPGNRQVRELILDPLSHLLPSCPL
jgi:hypothetical protein